MSSRTRSSENQPAARRGSDPTAPGPDADAKPDMLTEPPARLGVPTRLWIAVLIAACGAVLLSAGPFLGVLEPNPGAAYSSGFILVLLAVLPVVIAAALLVAGRPVGAAGVLVGGALLALGRALNDLQFAVDGLVASRPELAEPKSLLPLQTGVGTWLLLAGHVLTLVAGALVVVRAGAEPGSAIAAEFEEDGGERKQLLGGGLAFGGLTALGLLMPAYSSDNAFVLAPDLMNGPGLVMAGGLLVTVAVLLGCVFAGTSGTPKFGRGVLIGIAVAVLAVQLPVQFAGAAVDWLHTDWRSYLATAGAVGMLGTAVWPSGFAPWKREHGEPREQHNADRLHLSAGLLAILAGVFAILGRSTELFVVEIPTDQPISQTDILILLSGVNPETYANRLLLPAAILLIVLGVLLLIRPVAGIARPALSVAWVAIPLAGQLALDAVNTATGTSHAIRTGAGAVWTLLAILAAVVAAVCAGMAGAVERNDFDLTERRPVNIVLAAPVAAAALFAIGAFGLPTMRAQTFVAPGLWQNLRLASWGLLFALLAVILVAVIATRSRPSRAASMLFGAAAVVGVHALELPLTQARAADATAAAGTWLSLACIAALVISAFVALAVRPERR
jgi:hypothetical protein